MDKKQQRKMLNKAWNKGHDCNYFDCKKERQFRREDVTEILKEALGEPPTMETQNTTKVQILAIEAEKAKEDKP